MPEKNRFPAVLQPKPVVIDRAAFNQGQNAQYEPHIEQTEVMDTVVARGPHAVGVPMMYKIRGGSPTETGEQGGTPGKVAGKGFLGSEDKAFIVAPTVTTCKGSRGGSSSEAIDEITAIHLAQQQASAIPIQDGRVDTTGAQSVGQPIPYRKSKRAQDDKDDETWVPADASNTLNNFDLGDTRTTPAVVEPHIVQASELRLRGQISEQQTVPTLLANTKSGDNDPLAVHPVAFQPGNLRRQAGADPSAETFPTIKCDAGDQSPHVANHPPMAVRRLTPVECERLQGFPDNWSRIAWKGKPEEDCPDGPRYKACGNSMAVPVMRWIGSRIAAVEARDTSQP